MNSLPPHHALICGLACALLHSSAYLALAKPPRPPKPAPSATPSEAAKPAGTDKAAVDKARIRLWKACDPADSPLQVVFIPTGLGAAGGPTPLPIDNDAFQFNGYLAVPPTAGRIEVTLAGHAPIRLPVNLSEGGDFTILVQVRGKDVSARWINDTPVAEESGVTFKVFNLLAGSSGDVQVTLGDVMTLHFSLPGANSRVGGLKPAVYPVTIGGVDAEGKTFSWVTETDLKKHRHSSLLIFPDSYGRIRPRLIEDGAPAEGITKGLVSKGQN